MSTKTSSHDPAHVKVSSEATGVSGKITADMRSQMASEAGVMMWIKRVVPAYLYPPKGSAGPIPC